MPKKKAKSEGFGVLATAEAPSAVIITTASEAPPGAGSAEWPEQWHALSATGRAVLSAAMYGDVGAGDEVFGPA